jgi:hypothetical protein
MVVAQAVPLPLFAKKYCEHFKLGKIFEIDREFDVKRPAGARALFFPRFWIGHCVKYKTAVFMSESWTYFLQWKDCSSRPDVTGKGAGILTV